MTIACIVLGPRPTLPLVATASLFGSARARSGMHCRFPAEVGIGVGRRIGALAVQRLPGD